MSGNEVDGGSGGGLHRNRPASARAPPRPPEEAVSVRFRLRLVVLGQGSVGKTAVLQRFLDDTFSEQHRETVEDLHSRIYRINGVKLLAEMLDTAGNLSFPAMRRISIANASGFLLVYSIADKESFDTVQTIVEEICQVRKADLDRVPIVIVGNMVDLTEARRISASYVTQWLIEHPGNLTRVSHMEVSAKTGYQVKDAFREVIRLSGVLDELAAIVAASTPESTPSATATPTGEERSRRRFSFNRPLFGRSRSLAVVDNDSLPSATRSPNKSSGKVKRHRTRSTAGQDDECEDCKIQ
uniref:Uncharacterized protein n=1 Tax=Plectus sambesii TaxID=2011161 RepID=A0A914W703_9BILA